MDKDEFIQNEFDRVGVKAALKIEFSKVYYLWVLDTIESKPSACIDIPFLKNRSKSIIETIYPDFQYICVEELFESLFEHEKSKALIERLHATWKKSKEEGPSPLPPYIGLVNQDIRFVFLLFDETEKTTDVFYLKSSSDYKDTLSPHIAYSLKNLTELIMIAGMDIEEIMDVKLV